MTYITIVVLFTKLHATFHIFFGKVHNWEIHLLQFSSIHHVKYQPLKFYQQVFYFKYTAFLRKWLKTSSNYGIGNPVTSFLNKYVDKRFYFTPATVAFFLSVFYIFIYLNYFPIYLHIRPLRLFTQTNSVIADSGLK